MRTSAFNNRCPAWYTDNVSGLKRRVSILLGLDGFRTGSLAGAFEEAGAELMTSEQIEGLHGPAAEGELVADQTGIRRRFLEVPLIDKLAGTAAGAAGTLFREIAYLRHGAVTGRALRQGIQLDHYRVGPTGSGGSYQAIFSPHDDEDWRVLGAYGSKDAAVASVNALRRFLIRLNEASEGFHIVEHILLRPLSQGAHHGVPVLDSFYSFRISILLPDWTARFHTPGFRTLLEETVHRNCPAHISPEFHWLDLDRMKSFEEVYEDWLDLKGDEATTLEYVDAASEKLIDAIVAIGAEIAGSTADQT